MYGLPQSMTFLGGSTEKPPSLGVFLPSLPVNSFHPTPSKPPTTTNNIVETSRKTPSNENTALDKSNQLFKQVLKRIL
jgi:hypothetical protein